MSAGIVLLGLWLIVHGLTALVPTINAAPMGVILAIIAVVAGILLLLGK